jgi:hypothetical protein
MKINLTQKLIILTLAGTAFQPGLAQSATMTQLVVQATPKETLSSTASGTTQVRFDVAVSGTPVAIPTGNVTFSLTPEATNESMTATVSLVSGVASWVIPTPTGTYSISATYSGDQNYHQQVTTSRGTGQSLPPDFDFSTSTIRIKQGETWSGTVQIVPLNGFNQTLSLTCLAPLELKCNLPTHSYSIAASASPNRAQNLSLTISAFPGQFAASLLFMFVPIASRYQMRRLRRLIVSLVLIVAMSSFSGCASTTGALWQPITPKGAYHVSIVGSSGGAEHVGDITVIVE